jgi:hypothetical protein
MVANRNIVAGEQVILFRDCGSLHDVRAICPTTVFSSVFSDYESSIDFET